MAATNKSIDLKQWYKIRDDLVQDLVAAARHSHLEKLPVLGLGFRCYLKPKPKPKT